MVFILLFSWTPAATVIFRNTVRSREPTVFPGCACATLLAATTHTRLARNKMFLLLLFFSLNPILGHACSCVEFLNRFETLSDGIERGEVYSAVVISATCTCVAHDVHYCRTYSYSASNDSYTAEVVAQVYVDSKYNIGFVKTCVEAENDLAPGIYLYCALLYLNMRTVSITGVYAQA